MSTDSIARKFNCRAADLIIAAGAITESAIARKDFLASKRATWQDPFFDTLRTRIDNAARTYLGQDSAKDLRHATTEVTRLIGNSRTLLAEVKVQIDEDFKKDPTRRDTVLKDLGFTPWYAAARRGDQADLISLLFQFKNNLTPALKAEIVEKGTAAETLDALAAHADTLHQSNLVQEVLKSARKELTAAAVTELNEIYDTVISICKIAAKFYKEDAVARSQFSFSGVVAAINASATPAAKKAARKAMAKIEPLNAANGQPAAQP